MTIDLIDRAGYQFAKRRYFASKGRRRGTPIVVFAMAKSGTTAVAAGLRAAGHEPVFQVHDLDAAFLADEERQYHWSGRPWRNWDARIALARPPTSAAPWRVVSLVREPIAQKASAFFQPGARRGYLNDGATVESLLEQFGDRLEQLPLAWFETHLQPTLDIDVYGTEFDPERGYQIIATPKVKLLLLRCEGIGVAPEALAELLDLDGPVDIPRKNVGAEKDYGELYDGFVAALRPPEEVIDRAYTSRLVQHFYSAAEIARFREFWSAGPVERSDGAR
jgi:hypothetical protein